MQKVSNLEAKHLKNLGVDIHKREKREYSFVRINTNQFIKEIKDDLQSLEKNINSGNYEIAQHYCNEISDLSKWLCEYLKSIIEKENL